MLLARVEDESNVRAMESGMASGFARVLNQPVLHTEHDVQREGTRLRRIRESLVQG
jgi:hypothetical protein